MRNFVVTVNGKSYEVGVEEVGATSSQKVVAAPVAVPASAPSAAPVVTQSASPAPAAKVNLAKGEKLLAPFPGLIKGLLVEEGAKVEKDQPILVLEAMKMDNEITAPVAGVVSFAIAKGANVESDEVLAVIG